MNHTTFIRAIVWHGIHRCVYKAWLLGGRGRPHDDIAWGLPNTVSHKEQTCACKRIMIKYATCVYTDGSSVACHWSAQHAGETYPDHMYCC